MIKELIHNYCEMLICIKSSGLYSDKKYNEYRDFIKIFIKDILATQGLVEQYNVLLKIEKDYEEK